MDAMLKICVQGWKPYWWSSLNRFDFVVTVLIVCLHFFSFFYHDSRNWVSYLIIMRGFRIFTLVTLVSRWWLVAQTLLHAIPATAPVLVLQFLVCSFFSLLGMHLFGGLVYAGNPALQGTEYLTSGYDAFNYNDFASAMVTSFNLCVANKWYVIMDAYAAATGNRWVQSFFIAFWVLDVAFMLNVVLAFFVEAFTSQMEKEERARVHEQWEMHGQKKSGGILPFRTTKSSSCDIYEDGTRYCR
jgi:two pore calcium channel protein